MRKHRLLGISGSLREQSYNTIILETLAETLGERASMSLFPLDEVPHYNEDLDTDTPPSTVSSFRAAIEQADGLIIATPEFNHGLPGVLKNALDWASRPRGRAALIMKPVLTITSSLAITGGVRAHAQLNETLLSIAARIVVRPQAVIGVVHQKVRDGRLADEATLKFLSASAEHLFRVIETPSPVQIEQA